MMCDQYYSAFIEKKNHLYSCPNNTRPSPQVNFHSRSEMEIKQPLHYTQKCQTNNQKTNSIMKYSGSGQLQTPISYQQAALLPNRNRYMPYNNRTFVTQNVPPQTYLNQTSLCNRNFSPNFFETDHLPTSQNDSNNSRLYSMAAHNTIGGSMNVYNGVKQNEFLRQTSPCLNDQQILSSQQKSFVTLQISNLDNALEETNLRSFLLSQLKPITPIVSIVFEGSTYVKVTVPDLNVSIIFWILFDESFLQGLTN